MKTNTVFALIALFLGFHMQAHAQQADHSSWNSLLQKHVSVDGKVNYAGFKADQAKLNEYLKHLSGHAPQANWSKSEKGAFWINAYNAFTVKLIVDNYPLKSIMDLEKGKPWDKKFIVIGGKTYSLNDIEHNILRKSLDARLHFAINCASVSCPELFNMAFMPVALERQLNARTRLYINNKKHNQVSSSSLKVSQIFDWYKDDFIKDKGSVQAYLNAFTKADIPSSLGLSYNTYNWNLNK